MPNFNEILTNFPYAAFVTASINLILILAVFHWFPWSYHIGRKLTNYEAFLTGCGGILGAFGKYVMIIDAPASNWLRLAAVLILLHWPVWVFPGSRTLGRVRSFVMASIVPMLTFAGWMIWQGDTNAAAAVVGLYAVGFLATLSFYWLDSIGEDKNAKRINGK